MLGVRRAGVAPFDRDSRPVFATAGPNVGRESAWRSVVECPAARGEDLPVTVEPGEFDAANVGGGFETEAYGAVFGRQALEELHKPKGQGPSLKSIFKGVSSALLFSSHRSDETVHNKSDLSEPLLE